MNEPTIRVPTCSKCGAVASPGEAFCRNCGNPLVAPRSPQPGAAPMSTVTAVSPMGAQQPVSPRVNIPPRKHRSPFLMGCLIFLGLLGVIGLAGGIYVWRSASYTSPERKEPAIRERAAGTMTEFPVSGDAQPTN